MTSPMPRIRPARRSGWKTSSASVFSPVPMNLTARPVTALIESAAPPRASPSIFVRIRPGSGAAPAAPGCLVGLRGDRAGEGARVLERLGARDGLLAGHRVDDEQRLDGL